MKEIRGEITMGYKMIYQSEKVEMGLQDLEVWKDEGIYNIGIESLLYYKNIEDLKSYYSGLLNGCKEFLKKQYKLIDKTENLCDYYVVYEFYYNESLQAYSMCFKAPEFLNIESIYNWICKAIKQISN